MVIKFWENLSFAVKTFVLVAILLSFSIITGVRYHMLVKKLSSLSVSQTTDVMLTSYKNELKDMVDMMAVSLASATKGVTDENEVYHIFKNLVQTARFFPDQSGYMFIYKKGGTVFVLPPKQELEGKNIMDLKDAKGTPLIQQLDQAAQNGGGFVEYLWDKPNQGVQPKLSYARMIPGGKYWIGTGIYIDDIQKKKESILNNERQLTTSVLTSLYIVIGLAFVVIVLPLSWLLIKSIVTPVRELTEVADKFSLGKMDLDIPYTDRTDEIGKMANALKRLGTSVKMAIARLKK